MKVAIVGDSFTDVYCTGEVSRISPEAPVQVLDVVERTQRPGGALNVAFNLFSLGIKVDTFTITDWKLPFAIISPPCCAPLIKTRFVAQGYQLLRVDEPKIYDKLDLEKMVYPSFDDYDIIAFIDYNKGVVKGGECTIVDSKKTDLSVFDAKILKINEGEKDKSKGIQSFPQAFITRGKKGIDYYRKGTFIFNEKSQAKEVIDVTGAGDTVTATLIYCLVNGITKPKEMMELANKAASAVLSRFGTAIVTLKDLT